MSNSFLRHALNVPSVRVSEFTLGTQGTGNETEPAGIDVLGFRFVALILFQDFPRPTITGLPDFVGVGDGPGFSTEVFHDVDRLR